MSEFLFNAANAELIFTMIVFSLVGLGILLESRKDR